jgi:hypothetical protein
VAIVSLTEVLAQGGWVREPGAYYFKLSYGVFDSEIYHDTLGIIAPGAEAFSQRNLFVYGEYGIAPSLALILNWAPWKANRLSSTDWTSGLGDPLLEMKYALPLPLAASLSLAAEIPIGHANRIVSDRSDPQRVFNLPTGDGEWNFLGILGLSHSFHPEPAYVQGFVGYNYRTAYQGISFQNQIRYGFELGYQIGGRLWINGALRGQTLTGRRLGPTGDFTRGDGVTFNQWQLGASLPVWKDLKLTFDFLNYADLFEIRRNIYTGAVFIVGVAL